MYSQKIIIGAGVANRDYDIVIKAIESINNINLIIKSSNVKIEVPLPDNVFLDTNLTRFNSTTMLLPYYYEALATVIPLKKPLDYCNRATIMCEAMAMRCPVIVTKSKANYINVAKEKIGLEVDFGDIKGWEEAIKYSIEHPDHMREMGERAYYLAKTKYNYNIFCKEILDEINNPIYKF